MKDTKKDLKEKLNFSKIEIILMCIMVAIVVITGITLFTLTTRKQNVTNIKKDAALVISAAKNAYAAYSFNPGNKYIVTGSDLETKGMCITIKGLSANDFLSKEYKDWNGYVVIEEKNHSYNYTIWMTNKKYVIDGYDSKKIEELKLNEGISAYNNDDFVSKVKTSFTGTTNEKGGTGSNEVIRYETECINQKID